MTTMYVTYKEFAIDVADRARRLLKGNPEKLEEWSKMLQVFWDMYWAPLAIKKDGQVHITDVIEAKVDIEEGRPRLTKLMTDMFHASDLDSDGHISLEEMTKCFEAWGVNPKDAQHSFKVMDTNSDGEISLEEFVSAGVSYFSDQYETVGQYFFGQLE